MPRAEPAAILIIGEWLSQQYDEGIQNLVFSLADEWGKYGRVLLVNCGSQSVRPDWLQQGHNSIANVRTNRLFLSLPLRSALRAFCPEMIFYVSPSCAKTTALFRSKVLKAYAPRAKVFVVALQPVHYSGLERRLLPLLTPDGIFVQSPRSMELLRGLPCPVRFLPSGVDTSRFVPVAQEQKRELRRKYEVGEGTFVVLHVGHINRKRNIQLLQGVVQQEGVQVIIVGSTSTPQDDGLARELAQAGVRVIREYLPHIEELYQLADVYLFPVTSEDAAIGVPLSVLEAMACNLPVITTRFGGLPLMFQPGGGFFYFDREVELPELIVRARALQDCSTRRMVEPYDWRNVANMLLQMAMAGENEP